MSGSGDVAIAKMMRSHDCKLAHNTDELRDFATVCHQPNDEYVFGDNYLNFSVYLIKCLNGGATAFGEISQGFSLSLDHSFHPYCTSRNCTPAQYMSDLGVPLSLIGTTIANFRTYPIRVGNVHNEEGEMVGWSGPFYPDEKEVSWEQVVINSGMPHEMIATLTERERTTVTKRIRRVAQPDNKVVSNCLIRDLLAVVRPDILSINFLNYIDYTTENITCDCNITPKVNDYINDFHDIVLKESIALGYDVAPKIGYLGFGPDIENCFER